MKYDFTSIMDRRGKDAIAVDMIGQPGGFAPAAPLEGFEPIPMWVADMNFPVVPTIPAAMIERVANSAQLPVGLGMPDHVKTDLDKYFQRIPGGRK